MWIWWILGTIPSGPPGYGTSPAHLFKFENRPLGPVLGSGSVGQASGLALSATPTLTSSGLAQSIMSRIYTSFGPAVTNTTLFLEAFGQLTPGTAVINAEEEDLHSVFRARAELMSWSSQSHTRHSVLWNMHEAEVTAGSADSRIGYAQVGMDGHDPHFLHRYAIDPGRALPALSQCLDDSLRRFGTVTLAGLQVALHDLRPLAPDSVIDYVSPRNWFNLASLTGAKAHIAFDHAWLGDRIGELPDRFPNPGPFEFGPVVTLPAPHRIQGQAENYFVRNLEAASLGLAVTLPEWSASAAGWALALALYTTRTVLWPEAPRHCAVRVTRVQ